MSGKIINVLSIRFNTHKRAYHVLLLVSTKGKIKKNEGGIRRNAENTQYSHKKVKSTTD